MFEKMSDNKKTQNGAITPTYLIYLFFHLYIDLKRAALVFITIYIHIFILKKNNFLIQRFFIPKFYLFKKKHKIKYIFSCIVQIKRNWLLYKFQ